MVDKCNCCPPCQCQSCPAKSAAPPCIKKCCGCPPSPLVLKHKSSKKLRSALGVENEPEISNEKSEDILKDHSQEIIVHAVDLHTDGIVSDDHIETDQVLHDADKTSDHKSDENLAPENTTEDNEENHSNKSSEEQKSEENLPEENHSNKSSDEQKSEENLPHENTTEENHSNKSSDEHKSEENLPQETHSNKSSDEHKSEENLPQDNTSEENHSNKSSDEHKSEDSLPHENTTEENLTHKSGEILQDSTENEIERSSSIDSKTGEPRSDHEIRVNEEDMHEDGTCSADEDIASFEDLKDECFVKHIPCECNGCNCHYCQMMLKNLGKTKRKCTCQKNCLCESCEFKTEENSCHCIVCFCDPCLADPERKKGSKQEPEPCLCEICTCKPCLKKVNEDQMIKVRSLKKLSVRAFETNEEENVEFECHCEDPCECVQCKDSENPDCLHEVEETSVVSESEENIEDTEDEENVNSWCLCTICYCEPCTDPTRKYGSPMHGTYCSCPLCECTPSCPKQQKDAKEEVNVPKTRAASAVHKLKNPSCDCPVCLCDNCNDDTIEMNDGHIKVSSCDCPACLCDNCE